MSPTLTDDEKKTVERARGQLRITGKLLDTDAPAYLLAIIARLTTQPQADAGERPIHMQNGLSSRPLTPQDLIGPENSAPSKLQEDTYPPREVLVPMRHGGIGAEPQSLPPVVTTQPQADAGELFSAAIAKAQAEGSAMVKIELVDQHKAPAPERSDPMPSYLLDEIWNTHKDRDPRVNGWVMTIAKYRLSQARDRETIEALRTPAPVDAEKLADNAWDEAAIQTVADVIENASAPWFNCLSRAQSEQMAKALLAADIFAVPKP